MQVEPPPEPEPVPEESARRKAVPRTRGSHEDRMLLKRQRSAAKLGTSSMWMLVACIVGYFFFGVFGVLGCAFLSVALGVTALVRMRLVGAPDADVDGAAGIDRLTARMWMSGRRHAWGGVIGGGLILLGTVALVVAAAAAFGSA